MKTPDSKKKPEGKEAKAAFKAAGRGGSSPTKPGFGMAAVAKKPNGTYTANVRCVNGDPTQNPVSSLPKGAKYYNSREAIPDTGDISVYLPDSLNIDATYLFPWSTTQPDPLRYGGGIVKGTLDEGSQRAGLNPGDPLFAPILVSDWINGTAMTRAFTCVGDYGFPLVAGAKVFGLALLDPVTNIYTMKYMAQSRGTCLDI